MSFVSPRGSNPHFGPDGRIYAQERADRASGRGSSTASTTLIAMSRSGHDVREVASAELATSIRLAPDGRHIAFEDGQQIYLAAATPTGKSLQLDAAKPAFPTVRLSKVGGAYLNWNADGSAVSWSTGSELKTVTVAAAMTPGFEPGAAGVDLSMIVDADTPNTRLALTNARIVTMNAAREVIEGGTLLLEGNRIRALGSSDLAIPEGFRPVDMTGKTLLPGLVDIHAHGPYGSNDIIPQQNWDLLAHLALGVTTVHNPASTAHLVFAAAEYARAGRILGPRIFSTAETIYGARSTNLHPVETFEDALAHVRRLKAQGAVTVKNYNQPRRDQRQMVIEAARQEGLMPVAEGGALYHMDMNLIGDGITDIEHNVPVLTLYDDVIQYWRQSQAGYTPTLVVTFGGLTSEDYYYQDTEVWKHPLLANFVPPTVLQPRSVRRPMAPDADYRDDDAAAAAKSLLEQGILVNTGGHGQRGYPSLGPDQPHCTERARVPGGVPQRGVHRRARSAALLVAGSAGSGDSLKPALWLARRHHGAGVRAAGNRTNYKVERPSSPVRRRSSHFGVARAASVVARLSVPGTTMACPFRQARQASSATSWTSETSIDGRFWSALEPAWARATMSVAVMPGQRVVRVTPVPRSSSPSASDRDST